MSRFDDIQENTTKTFITSHGHVHRVHMLNWQILLSRPPAEAEVTVAAPHDPAGCSTLDLEGGRPAMVLSARA